MLKTILTVNEAIKILKNNQEIWKKNGITKMFLFGSIVSGKIKNSSDIDILVDIQKSYKTYSNLLAIKKSLREKLDRKIDLVFLDSVNPVIYEAIKKEMIKVE
jgi:uncharacterized protein